MSAWTVIAHTELGSAQAAITFSSISASYTDLLLVYSTRASVADGGVRVKINTSTSNFTIRALQGSGSAASSYTETNYIGVSVDSSMTASTFGNGMLYFPNYASSAAKSFSNDLVSENNATASFQTISAGLWNQTTAINAVEIYAVSGNFVQYSSATLYGILKGSSGGVTVS
jgi:hypothetical protein